MGTVNACCQVMLYFMFSNGFEVVGGMFMEENVGGILEKCYLTGKDPEIERGCFWGGVCLNEL